MIEPERRSVLLRFARLSAEKERDRMSTVSSQVPEGKINYDHAPENVERFFKLLTKQLALIPLPTQVGTPRHAAPWEFMLMHTTHDQYGLVVGFKHRDTRNYVFLLIPESGDDNKVRLHVPQSQDAFMRGFFDRF
jgi:hypothetical protein